MSTGRKTTLQEAGRSRRQVQALVRAGLTHQQIATETGIARPTVTYYANTRRRKADAAGWRCERCQHPNDLASGHVLTVHHLDGNKYNCADWNLAALCQRCHLTIQARVRMEQGSFGEILAVSAWFKPHLEGYLRAKAGNGESGKAGNGA